MRKVGDLASKSIKNILRVYPTWTKEITVITSNHNFTVTTIATTGLN